MLDFHKAKIKVRSLHFLADNSSPLTSDFFLLLKRNVERHQEMREMDEMKYSFSTLINGVD